MSASGPSSSADPVVGPSSSADPGSSSSSSADPGSSSSSSADPGSGSSSSADPTPQLRSSWPKLSTLRMRQAFTYSDFVDDTAQRCEDILCLDEEQQEELIRQLRREDIHRNEFYCKAIMVLTLLPIMFFAIRYYYMTSNGWLFNADLFSAASLLVSYKSVPTVILGFRDAPADMLRTEDYVSLRSPGSFWLKMQRMNIVISAIMCMWTWMRHSWAIGEKPLYSEDYLCALPFIMAVIVYLMRKAMEAVNFGELEHLRYEFRGA